MTILALAVMVPLFGFYLYALVNFQKELRRAKTDELVGARTICRQWIAAQQSGDELFEGSEIEPQASAGTREDQAGAQRPREPYETEWAGRIYQFESLYLGPFLLVPVRSRNRSHRAP
jgi:hypothetical protein